MCLLCFILTLGAQSIVDEYPVLYHHDWNLAHSSLLRINANLIQTFEKILRFGASDFCWNSFELFMGYREDTIAPTLLKDKFKKNHHP